MRSYKFKRKTDLVRARGAFNEISNREHFLLDLKSLHMNCKNNSYFIFDSVHCRTIEKGKYQYLDETYILCREGLIPHIYE